MKKKPDLCGYELHVPQLAPVSCPACALVIGEGAFLNTSDPCFHKDWGDQDYVVISGVRIDMRTQTLMPKFFHGHKCEQCARNERKISSPWGEGKDRRNPVVKG